MSRKYLSYICIVMSVFLLSCTGNPSIAGGGLDTESSGGKLAGIVVDRSDLVVESTLVTLIPSDYTPFSDYDLRAVITDANGLFHFDSIDSGVYNVQAHYADDGSAFLYRGVHVKNDSNTVDRIPLSQTGSIRFERNDSLHEGILYIPGTLVYKVLSGIGSVQLDSVPVGTLPPLFHRDNASEDIRSVTDSLIVNPSETTFVNTLSMWSAAKRIVVNTENIGTRGEVLTDIPVLISLTNDNFSFDSVRTDGGDIRFYSSSGTPLNHETEYWNSVDDSACIWVRLDTLHLNGADTYLWLYSGSDSTSVSDPNKVFDTTIGFRGVWHLYGEKDGVSNRDVYLDATGHNHHGEDNIKARGTQGVIGKGKEFLREELDYIAIGSFPADYFTMQAFTISLWFQKKDTLTADLFVHKNTTDSSGEWGLKCDSNNAVVLYSIKEDTLVDTLCVSPPVSSGEWHHLCVSKDAAGNLSLYTNGEMVASSVISSDFVGKEGESLYIGSNMNTASSEPYNALDGFMDEVRLESIARSKEWVMFNYQNQFTNKNIISIE